MIISHISFSQGNHNFILAIITTISIMGMMMMMITVEPSQWGKLTISAGPDKHNIHGNDDVIIIIINVNQVSGVSARTSVLCHSPTVITLPQ